MLQKDISELRKDIVELKGKEGRLEQIQENQEKILDTLSIRMTMQEYDMKRIK